MRFKQIRAGKTAVQFRGALHLDTSVRFVWTGGTPGLDQWSDANFLLAEVLRDKFDINNVVRLGFRAIPDTEEEYEIEAEVVLKRPVRLHHVRSPRESHGSRKQAQDPRTTGDIQPVLFTTDPFGVAGLSDEDESLRTRFNKLPLQSRLRLWQRYIAPLCK